MGFQFHPPKTDATTSANYISDENLDINNLNVFRRWSSFEQVLFNGAVLFQAMDNIVLQLFMVSDKGEIKERYLSCIRQYLETAGLATSSEMRTHWSMLRR